MEEWRAIDDFPDYEVSNLGRVKSLKTGKGAVASDGILKPFPCHKGYLSVGLCRDNIKHTKSVATLVNKAFNPPIEGKPETDHINRNITDNRSCNLRWADRYEQVMNRNLPPNNLNQKNIFQNKNSFMVRILREKKIITCKTFKTLEEAISYRDQVLQTL